jgi:hypothetical protein
MISSENYAESPLALASSLHGINLDILVTSAFLRSFTSIGEVVIDGIPQSIIGILAESAGARITYLADHNLCRQQGFPFLKAIKDVGVSPVCLNSNSMDIEFSPKVDAGYEGLAEQPHMLRLRTPDQYLSGRKNLSWLALSTLYEDLLLASEGTVSKHAPLLSGFVNKESAKHILKWCLKTNYKAVTNTLEPLNESNADSYCWLVPSENFLENVNSLLASHAFEVNVKLPLTHLAEQAWPELLGANDKLATQTKDFFIHKRRWYYLDRILNIGMYPMESDGEHYWRWVGDNGVRLFLPLRAKGHYVVSFDVFSLVNGLTSSTLRCFVNGALKLTQDVQEGENVKIPYYASQDGYLAELYVVSEQSVNIDGKAMSVSLSSLNVEWEEMPL